MPRVGSESSHRLSTLDPQDSPDKLKAWWKASKLDHYKYRAYKVRVGPRSGSTLNFEFAGDAWKGHPQSKQAVDLSIIAHVYPDVPSTIQRAKEKDYAFLLLTDSFVTSKTGLSEKELEDSFAEGGGKWPFGAGGRLMSKSDARKAVALLQETIEGMPDDEDMDSGGNEPCT